jgi:3-methyladenine DNA glycosylase AlkD
MTGPTAAGFVDELGAGPHRAATIFALAERSIALDVDEIEKLLDSPDPDVRLGAVCVMDFQARRRSTPAARRRDLYELYLRRHDRIDTWSMVDRAAPWVVGGYLADKPRDPLYELARSPHWWERRTAITATWVFIRADDLDDTFGIAELLVDDPEHFVQTAVGGWVREAGKRDLGRLRAFLDRHAATMPRTMLRFAVEHLDADERASYRSLAQRPDAPSGP